MNFLYRLASFMNGRRGWDQFGLFLMIASFVIEIIGNILRIRLIYYIGLAMFFYCVFRIFSKNIFKREMENRKFMSFWFRFKNGKQFWEQKRQEKEQKKNGTYTYTEEEREKNGSGGKTVYAYYYCPSCKQQVRIPAGKGRVKVTCPRCGENFDANS